MSAKHDNRCTSCKIIPLLKGGEKKKKKDIIVIPNKHKNSAELISILYDRIYKYREIGKA